MKKTILNVSLFLGSTIGIIGNAVLIYLVYSQNNIGPLSLIYNVSLFLFILNILINIFSLVNIFLSLFRNKGEEDKKE